MTVVCNVKQKEEVINLINIIKNDIIMLIDKKYLDKFLEDGWVEYKGSKKPSVIYEGE